jgi:hypothetical protein
MILNYVPVQVISKHFVILSDVISNKISLEYTSIVDKSIYTGRFKLRLVAISEVQEAVFNAREGKDGAKCVCALAAPVFNRKLITVFP